MSFSIDDLIDDCLLLIFYRLSLGDRIKSRLTCNRWATLMPFDDIDSLNVDSLSFAREQFAPAQYRYKIRRSSILRAFDFILPQIGANLKSLSLGTTNGDSRRGKILLLNNYHFDMIIHFCPQLKKLEIGFNADLSQIDFVKLATQLSQMSSLQTLSVCHCKLKDLPMILIARAFGERTWPYLTDLTANFRILSVMVAPQLKNLTLPYVNSFTLSKWCEAHPNLTGLHLTGINERFTNCSSVSSLQHLTTLNMAFYQLYDLEFNRICSSCPELVSVSLNLTRVTSTRYNCLLRLKNLTALRIVTSAKFNASDLVGVVKRLNLRTFHFRDDSLYTTALQRRSIFDVTSLVNFNPNLEVLKLRLWVLSEETILTVLGVCKQLRTLVLYNNATFSSDLFTAVGSCKKLSKFKLGSAVVSAEHYRRLLNARQQNGLRHRLQVVVAGGFVWQQTDEKRFLKEELKKVNIFVSHWL